MTAKTIRRYCMRGILNAASRFGFDVIRRAPSGSDAYSIYPAESLRQKRFYNVGSGDFHHPFWTNIDHGTEHYRWAQRRAYIERDLTTLRPLPVMDATAELVYSSHTIEHVNDEAAEHMLKEACRILKPGGGIRLTTPDARLDTRAYLRGDRSYFYWTAWHPLLAGMSLDRLFLHHFATQLDRTDAEISRAFAARPRAETLESFTSQCEHDPAHPEHHMNWWTAEKLISFLKHAGFENPYRSGWGQSAFRPLRDGALFDSTHPRASLYVEAVKQQEG